MSQEELGKRNGNPFVERVLSWGNKPEIAVLRRGHVVTIPHNLRCRRGQGEQFDVAISITEDGSRLHLKNSVEKIDAFYEVAKLISIGVFGQSDWVSIDTKSGMLSISRKRLEATLRKLGLVPAA